MRCFNFAKKQNMKIYIYLLLAFILPIFTFGQETINYPIDITYDQSTENYYLSNWADGEGYILKLDKNGDVIENYFNGLHYAGGVCIVENTLYVLDNLDLVSATGILPSYLIGIDLTSGEEILNFEISTDGTYLDFVEFATGNLYINDSQKSIIYKYNIQNNTVEIFLTEISNPFGICYDDFNDRLIIASTGSTISYLKSVDPSGGSVTTPYYTDVFIKGVIMHPNTDFYYTSWYWGGQWGDEEVRKVNNELIWTYVPSDNHSRPFGLCIGYNDVIAICNWGDNTLSFLDDQVFSTDEISDKSDLYTIYPNPTNGLFYIGFTEVVTSNIDITILNMTGQQVYHEKLSNSDMLIEKKFELQHLPAGTYVMILKDDRSISQKKLIIR